jgi:allantoin racemase
MKDSLMVLPLLESEESVQWTQHVYRDVPGVDIVGIKEGKAPFVTYSDVEFNTPSLLNQIVSAEKEGYQSVIIGCFGDPGLAAARQLVTIPVVGTGESTFAVASTMGDRILIVVPCKDFVYATQKMVREYAYTDKVVSIRAIDVPLQALATESEDSIQNTAEMCLQAIREVDAHVVVLGCIGLAGFAEEMRDFFQEKEVLCPIIEPGITAMEYTRMILRLRLNQSRMMF